MWSLCSCRCRAAMQAVSCVDVLTLIFVVAKAFTSISERFVSGMAALDSRLEAIGVLSKLDEQRLPDSVLEDNGEPVTAYKEVSSTCAGL